MTLELIASMLGVCREGITEVAGNLQREGLISYHRGHITVLDRPGLESRACECYYVVRKEFCHLFSDMHIRQKNAATVTHAFPQMLSEANHVIPSKNKLLA